MEDNGLPVVLIADDAEINRNILSQILQNGFNLLEAKDGAEAISLLAQYNTKINLVLLDIVMPNIDGYGVLKHMKAEGWLKTIPVVVISAESDRKAVAKAYELGAVDYIARPFENVLVIQRVMKTINYYGQQRNLVKAVADELFNHEKNDISIMEILIHAVEQRCYEDPLHVARVQMLSEILLKGLLRYSGEYKITSEEINMITSAAALHDIGMLFVPEEILKKQEALTPDEEDIIHKHTVKGHDMFRSMPGYKDNPLFITASEICRWHHERWNGHGYPDNLKKDDIPISAQVVSLADTYDVLTSRKSYKRAYTHEEAMKMIMNGECGTFNPDLLSCLTLIEKKLPEKLASATGARIEANDIMKRVMIHILHKT